MINYGFISSIKLMVKQRLNQDNFSIINLINCYFPLLYTYFLLRIMCSIQIMPFNQWLYKKFWRVYINLVGAFLWIYLLNKY